MKRRRPTSESFAKQEPDIRERARAAGCYLHNFYRVDAPDAVKMAAFMSIFHPEIKGKKLKALIG